MIGFIVIAILSFLCLSGIDYWYQKRGKKDPAPEEMPQENIESASVLGKSNYRLCQALPNDAKGEKTEENRIKNVREVSNFVSQEEEIDSGLMDIAVPLSERKNEQTGDSPDEEEEETEELFEKDAVVASGLTIDEMLHTNKVIEDTQSTEKDEEQAGKVLYENKETEMVGQMASDNQVRLERIRSLMYLHEAKHGITTDRRKDSGSKSMDDTDFNISDFIR